MSGCWCWTDGESSSNTNCFSKIPSTLRYGTITRGILDCGVKAASHTARFILILKVTLSDWWILPLFLFCFVLCKTSLVFAGFCDPCGCNLLGWEDCSIGLKPVFISLLTWSSCVRVCALVSYMRRPACVFLSNFRSMLVLLLVPSLFERGFVAAAATQSPRFLNETTSLLSVCVIREKVLKIWRLSFSSFLEWLLEDCAFLNIWVKVTGFFWITDIWFTLGFLTCYFESIKMLLCTVCGWLGVSCCCSWVHVLQR